MEQQPYEMMILNGKPYGLLLSNLARAREAMHLRG